MELYDSIFDALDVIAQQSGDRKATDRTTSLSHVMTDPGFIVGMCCTEKVIAVTVVLSRSFQSFQRINRERAWSL